MKPTTPSGSGGPPPKFATTHWSVVLAAAQVDLPHSLEAWQQLAKAYWFPLYAHIRRSGHKPEDARDLTQSFFMSLVHKEGLGGLVPGQGRFRSFLLVCLDRFLIDYSRYARAARRRPEAGWISLDESEAEGRYQAELVDHASPEALFERHWARTLVDQALVRLEAHYEKRGKRGLFDHLVGHLVRDPAAVPHAQLAAQLGISETVVKSEMHRLRKRFRLVFRQRVAATASAEEFEDELRHVRQILTG